ncbi:Wzz/FepE/Etk N-terminal domain-containing protein [Tepidibacillus fermentans]|uniref:Subunit length determinant protein n=1 Tax=Tepidibacillus fermentans TaxID=1281767 RepID=A0A4V2USY9_9BACI|nr:Wzz/FepE/Etk N-terminal domain-containing protein [Tepidibacillus fermentans]TCS83364.1 subunit length determinant protein [Tepidibacillus fermentans]
MASSKIDQISLRDMIETLLRNKKFILSSILIFVILAAAYSFLFTKPIVNVTTEATVKQVEGAESNFTIEPLLNAVIVPTYNSSANIQFPDVVTRPDSKYPVVKIDTLLTEYTNELTNNTKLVEEVRKISPRFKQVTGSSLKSMIAFDMVPDSDILTIKVTASTKEEAVKFAEIVNQDFQSFVEKQNFEMIHNKLSSIKHQLEFNIGLLETKIDRLQKEMATVDKTIAYQSSKVEPNPAYIMYVQNLSSNKIALNNAKSQYEEIQKVEKRLPQIAKETGLTVSMEQPVIETSSSLLKILVKNVVLAGMVGFVIAGFVAFLREYWKRTM